MGSNAGIFNAKVLQTKLQEKKYFISICFRREIFILSTMLNYTYYMIAITLQTSFSHIQHCTLQELTLRYTKTLSSLSPRVCSFCPW